MIYYPIIIVYQYYCPFIYIYMYIYIYILTTFKSVEGGPDREAPEVVWNTRSYI